LDNPFLRSQLVGRRLYLAKELSRDSFKHIDLVKAIVSGDPIHVEKKHKDGYTYRPQGRFIMESNVRPSVADTTDGFFRRLCQVTFQNQIPDERKDYNLHAKFTPEMPGIFAWAIEGLQRLLERGRFEQTRDSAEAAEQIAKHRASVKMFMLAATQEAESPEYMLTARELFASYQTWCTWEGVKAYYEDTESFARELLNRFPNLRDCRKRVMEDGKKVMCYTGIEWKDKRPWME
jgi:putative DNA primase/helicase